MIGEEIGQKINEEIEKKREITAIDIFTDKDINESNVSYDTINRFINNAECKARIKRKKP